MAAVKLTVKAAAIFRQGLQRDSAGDSSEVAGNNSGKDATGTAATTTARTMVGTDGKDHKAAYSNDS